MDSSKQRQYGWDKGYAVGYKRGLSAGYQKGADIAVQLWLEIGFYEGFCQAYLTQCEKGFNPKLKRHLSLVSRLLQSSRDCPLDPDKPEKSLQLIEEFKSMAKLLKIPTELLPNSERKTTGTSLDF